MNEIKKKKKRKGKIMPFAMEVDMQQCGRSRWRASENEVIVLRKECIGF